MSKIGPDETTVEPTPATDVGQLDLVLPATGKVFYEHKDELRLCQPHLMPLKSFTLNKLEKMQVDAQKRMQEARAQ